MSKYQHKNTTTIIIIIIIIIETSLFWDSLHHCQYFKSSV